MSTDEAEAPAVVDDPEGFVRNRRLSTIFDIRDELIEARRKIQLAKHQGRISEFEALSIYREHVHSYFVELEPLLVRYEPGPELLEETVFGTVKIEAPVRQGRDNRTEAYLPDDKAGSDWKHVVADDLPEALTYELRGLQVLSEDGPIRHTFEFEVVEHGTRPVSKTVERQYPRTALDAMVRQMNEFLAKIGLEVEPQQNNEWTL